tara:strand:+ start:1196 stop:4783 length:3588 start_codon:yes stop_codon:yes gene_type:complete
MGNTFLFDDLEEEDVLSIPKVPEQQDSTFIFDDLEEEEISPVVSEPTLPLQEGGAFVFEDLETDEDFDMSTSTLTEETITEPLDQRTDTETINNVNAIVNKLFEEDLKSVETRLDLDYRKAQLAIAQKDVAREDKILMREAKAKGISLEERKKEILKEYPNAPIQFTAEQRVDNVVGGRIDKSRIQKEKLLARLNNKNLITSGLSAKLLQAAEEGHLNLRTLNAIVLVDELLNPATALAELPIHWTNIQENVREGDYAAAAGNVGWAVLDAAAAIPVAGVVAKGITKTWKVVGNGGEYNRVQNAMRNENIVGEEIKKQNRIKAKANIEIKNDLIINFQNRNNVDISIQNKSGNFTIDPAKVRAAGKTKVKEYYIDDVYRGNNIDASANPLDEMYVSDEDVLAIPMLNPEKLDALVGVVADLKKEFPQLLKVPTVKITKGKNKGKQRRARPLVDQLFDLTVTQDLMADEVLYNILNRHGMSYEEYMLGVVGSASEAGRLLNRVSQMSRFKPKGIQELKAEKARKAAEKGLSKFWSNTFLRGENIRRGMMVSSLATAARNLQSGIIRAPAEAIANIFDTALITYSKAAQEGDRFRGIVGATKNVLPVVFDGTYSNAFRNIKYMFADQNTAEQYTKYILDRPELAKHFEKLGSNIAELQELTGRGQATTRVGQGLDKMASTLEDGVAFLNIPNRWQEMMLRHTTFFSEVERLTNAEWGIDLRKTLDEGRIKDVINDATDLRGSNGRSFISIMDEATVKALDVTYAKQPDFYPFKVASNLITNSGLTVIIPFPRFMFNSMEYMAQNVGGIGIAGVRKAMFKDARGALTPRDRQDISRNLTGLAAIYGMYQYRNSEDAGERYESMEYEDNQVDLTGTYPMRQIAWIAEFGKQQDEGTLDTWYGSDIDHITETWLGTSARTGVGNVMIDEIRDIIVGTGDMVDKNRRAKAIGGAVGQYVNTFFTPMFQLVEGQRALDIKSDVYVDAATDPTLNDDWSTSFGSGFSRSLIQRGLAAPSYEEDLPNRVSINTGDIKRYDPLKKLFFGLNIKEADNDITEYLLSIGYENPTYELGSRSKIPEEKRAENKHLSAILPFVVNLAKKMSTTGFLKGTNKSEEEKVARKFIRDMLGDAKQEFMTDGFASPYASAVDDLSRVPKDDRQYAIIQFRKLNKTKEFPNGRDPDPTVLNDIIMLLELSDNVLN